MLASTISVTAVVNVMLDDVVLIEAWNQLANVLGVRRADYFQEERGFNNRTASINELFQRILFCWSDNQARHGQPSIIGTLGDKLGELNFNATKDGLEEKFGNDARLLTEFGENQIVCSLKQKWWPQKTPLINSFVERTLDEVPLVAKLKSMLNHGEQKAVISPHQACISGFGGIGKTILAKWFANHYVDEFDHIVWLDCGEGALGSSIDRLWDNTCTSQGVAKPHNISDRASQCFKAFGECKTLVIFDNAEEYTGKQGIQPALPNRDQFPNIKCLITSRWAAWGSTAGHGVIPMLSLETFSLAESVLFLQNNLVGVVYKTQELEELSELLGHLPLALQICLAHANKFYSNSENRLSVYIARLKKADATVLKECTDVDGYNKGLLSIVVETKAKVVVNNPLAWNIMVTMAYLRCDLVCVRFLASVENCDYDTALVACQFLEKHSLVTITSPQDNYNFLHPKDKHYVSVHRLLQRTLQIWTDGNSGVQSKILCSLPKASEDVWYKWEPFLAAKDMPQLTMETKVAKKQIYGVVFLVRFLRNSRYEEAMCLLELYKDVTGHFTDYYECVHRGGLLSKFRSKIVGCKTCRRLQRKMTLVITSLTSYVLTLQGSYVEALKCFKSLDAKKEANVTVLYLSFNNFIFDSPQHWKETELDIFEVHISCILAELDKFIKTAGDEIQFIKTILTRGWGDGTVQQRSETAYTMDLVVPKDCSYLSLYNSSLSYESCVHWLRMFSNQEFSSYYVVGIQLVKESGSNVEEVDYHKVYSTKSEVISIDCSMEGSTIASFHLEELWHRTRELSLDTCRLKAGMPNNHMSDLVELRLYDLIDAVPPSLRLGEHFPKLKHLAIWRATLPLEFFPKNLKTVYLKNATIIPPNDMTLLKTIETLTLDGYPPFDILELIQYFRVQKLKLVNINWGSGRLSEDCTNLSLILERSMHTENLGNWNAAVVKELKLNGVDVNKSSYLKHFAGKTEL